VVPVPIAADRFSALKLLAREAAVPLKSVLLAAHLRVAALFSGQPDVVTGLVANGRPEGEGGERIAGLFLNTVPFRLSLPEGSWRDLARATFEAEKLVMPHRRYPMAALKRGQAGRALFETAFNFTHFHVYEGLAGVRGVRLQAMRVFEQTDIPVTANFSIDVASSRLELELSFDTGATQAEMERVRDGYARVLASMAADPGAQHDLADLLDPDERRRLLHAWNPAPAPLAAPWTLHGLFEREAARTPDAVAAEDGQRTLTYRELDAWATRLAHALAAKGVGPEVSTSSARSRRWWPSSASSRRAARTSRWTPPTPPIEPPSSWRTQGSGCSFRARASRRPRARPR
jgi:non-ribosomal peptide synthetase component F